MDTGNSSSQAREALSLMTQALEILDQANFAGEAAADLDHAICRLERALEQGHRPDGRASVDQHLWSTSAKSRPV